MFPVKYCHWCQVVLLSVKLAAGFIINYSFLLFNFFCGYSIVLQLAVLIHCFSSCVN
jgi:hypothetical protein